jgi:LAS superfamily LD-carboxypeptidase LdcB
MKKLIILILFILCSTNLTRDSLKESDIIMQFVIDNNLDYSKIEPYLQFKSFKINDYFTLEEIRQNHNYNYTRTINHFRYHKTAPAVFKESSLILVNKQFYLDKLFVPRDLVNVNDYEVNIANDDLHLKKEVIEAYLTMILDLKLDGLYLYSGYRTYERQKALYEYYQDDNYSAKPGFSEHQTGLALDVSTKAYGLTELFSETKEYQSLVKNCHKYGFILRYPQGKQTETGYAFEPWHFRYVGIIHATYIMKNNLSLEQYLFENFEF